MENHRYISGGSRLAKAIVLFVAFLFVIVPVAPAFAQVSGNQLEVSAPAVDAGSLPDLVNDKSAALPAADIGLGEIKVKPKEEKPVDAVVDDGSVIPVGDEVKDKSKDPLADPNAKPVDAAQPMALTAQTSGSGAEIGFNLPTTVKANVDQSTGDLTYVYPIELPEGRNKLTPQLSLNYNSRNSTKPDYLVGLGWDLSIPYIQREALKGSQNLYVKPFFSSSQSGNLIATSDTSASPYTLYRPEVDNGDYLKYVFNQDESWTVTGKNGLTYTYGATSASRQDNPGDSTKTYKWMLTKISDSHGNEIQYSYTKDSGQIYPAQIIYTYNPASPAVNTVNFNYSNITGGGATVYNSGFPVTTNKFLSSIVINTTISNQTSTRTYTMSFTQAQMSSLKLLNSITNTYDSPNVTSTPSFSDITTFTYSNKTPGWEEGGYSLASLDSFFASQWDSTSGNDGVYTSDFDHNGYQDLLFSYGFSNPGSKKLMLNNGTGFVDATTSWGVPMDANVGSNYSIEDVNGDNLPDFIGGLGTTTYLNTGSGFIADTAGVWKIENYVPEVVQYCRINGGDVQSSFSTVFLDDVNNDGKKDLIHFGQGSNFKVFLNNDNGWSYSPSYTFIPKSGTNYNFDEGCVNNSSLQKSNYQMMIDINADGQKDYWNSNFGAYLSTGNGYTYSESYSLLNSEIGRAGFGDINGDGLLDYVRYMKNIPTNETYLNTGTGFLKVYPGTPTRWNPGLLSYLSSNSNNWGVLMDLTSDGFNDVLGAGSTRTGTQLGQINGFNTGINSWSGNSLNPDTWGPLIRPGWGVYFDINNDGNLDFATPTSGWSGVTAMPKRVMLSKAGISNKLETITNSLGAQTKIDYGTAITNLGETNASTNSVVKKVTVSNIGFGQPDMVSQYSYDGGYYLKDPQTSQKRFTGFQKVSLTESGSNLSPLRITETYFHQANGSDVSTNEPIDASLSKIGKPYYTITRDVSGSYKKETWQKYGTNTLVTEPVLGRKSEFVYPTENVNKTTEPGSSVSTAETYSFDVSLGEQTSAVNLGFVTASSDGSYSDVAGDSRFKFTEYAFNNSKSLVKPSSEDVRTSVSAGDTLSRVEYRYDEQASGTIGSYGDLTKQISWVSGQGSVVANTTYTYDAFGNVLTEAVLGGDIKTYTYDVSKSKVASEVNGLGHITSYIYVADKLKQITDPNTRTITYTYASPGWLYSSVVKNTGGNQMTRNFINYDSNGWYVRTETQLVNTYGDDSFQSYDRLGRKIRKMRRLVNHTTLTSSDFFLKEALTYDALGRVVTVSAPYGISYSNITPLLTVTVPNNLITTTAYDVFDRPLSVVNALGATINSYAGVETTTTDANNHQKKTYTDAYGNLVQVKEYNASSIYTTNYTYDVRNLLTNITDALGNVRNFTYNNAGWVTSSEDLHALGDTTFGVTSWTYDLNGNKLVETQPNGTTVTKTYDTLNRVLTVDGSTTSGVDYTYTYDTCTNGKGRVCTVVGALPNGTTMNKSYVYGISGVPTSESLTTLGTTYTTSYLYNFSDEVSKITYPNGTVVRYAFGEWGLPSTVYTTLPGGTETTYAIVAYHHTLKPSSVVVTGGPTTTHNYDATKLYRESSMSSVYSGNTLQSYSYSYDNVNNITQIVEPGLTKGYSYDDLNRLTQAVYTPNSGTATTYDYAYDAIGNITSMNGQSYVYSGVGKTNPHAVTSVGSDVYTYDDNGNMLTAPGQAFTFNWQNQLSRVVVGGTTNVDSYYDENGQRFIYQTPSGTEVQAQADYMVRGSTPEISIKVGGSLVGTISGLNAYSSITDNLGTPVKQIGVAGSVAESVSYDPYGKVLSQTGTLNTKDGYIGQEYDVDTGLNYLNARYYSSSIGRFTSEDPEFINVGFDLSDPQSMNSYSYARNNPISISDPSGLGWWSDRYDETKVKVVNTWNTVKTIINVATPVVVNSAKNEWQSYMDFRQKSYEWQTQHPKLTEALVNVGAAVGGGITAKGSVKPVLPEGIAEVSPLVGESVYMKAANHIVDDHITVRYPGMSKTDIANLAEQTKLTADYYGRIKGVDPVSGVNVNKQYYGSKTTGQVFINTDFGPPTMFPKNSPEALQRYIRKNLIQDTQTYGRR